MGRVGRQVKKSQKKWDVISQKFIQNYCNYLIVIFYPLQNLARMFLISHFLTPTIISILLFNGSNPQRTLNACLGKFELNFVETSTDLCTLESASSILKIGCWMAYILYFILSCNLAESFMLYRCFKKIEEQTNDSKEFLTIHSYIRRRKWVPLWFPFGEANCFSSQNYDQNLG